MLLYAQGIDPYFENLVQNADDRLFYFEKGPRESRGWWPKPTCGRERARPRWRHTHDPVALA